MCDSPLQGWSTFRTHNLVAGYLLSFHKIKLKNI